MNAVAGLRMRGHGPARDLHSQNLVRTGSRFDVTAWPCTLCKPLSVPSLHVNNSTIFFRCIREPHGFSHAHGCGQPPHRRADQSLQTQKWLYRLGALPWLCSHPRLILGCVLCTPQKLARRTNGTSTTKPRRFRSRLRLPHRSELPNRCAIYPSHYRSSCYLLCAKTASGTIGGEFRDLIKRTGRMKS